MPPTVLALPYKLDSSRLARRLVEHFVAERMLDVGHALCVIASELVTNAVLHGREPVELSLNYVGGEVVITVTDGDPDVDKVRLRVVDQAASGGRGLLLVAALANCWGTRGVGPGKAVWATVRAA